MPNICKLCGGKIQMTRYKYPPLLNMYTAFPSPLFISLYISPPPVLIKGLGIKCFHC